MKSSRKKLSVVIDTNLLISSVLNALGLPHKLIQSLQKDSFILLTSVLMRQELDDVLHRPRLEKRYGLKAQLRDDLLLVVNTKGKSVDPQQSLPVSVRDINDNMVLATALGGKADYLVTGDEDLLELKENPEIGSLKICTVREFLSILKSDN